MKSEQPLGERRERILRAIVEAYIEQAEPVGSKAVADQAGLGVSSATVRNEMGILEREGYIVQPHTSAGRVPTEKAYRYYVDVLAPHRRLDRKQAQEIERSFSGTMSVLDDLLRTASDLLAELTDYTALASAPPLSGGRLRWLDLVPLGGRRVLIVVVGEGARHEEWTIELPSDAAEDVIRRAGERINRMAVGMTLSDAAEQVLKSASGQNAGIMLMVASALKEAAMREGRVFTGGASHSVGFGPAPEARRVLEAIEGGTIGALLGQAGPDQVSVRIGSELEMTELQSLSLIMAGYELGARAGSLGVLGPTRMDYPGVISAVVTVARSLTRALRRLEK
jgi:heat-inducible transcriptional repressor